MADKRISQLIERVDIANNDVLPIVASGATTTNKVTVSTLQDWMQDNLDVGVTSVGLTMPSAFQVSGSPITTSGNITVTATGTASQYIRGDGTLADFPQGGGGGGASVSYYLNGSVSQGTIGGVTYLEMNKTPVLGAGTDFTIATNGYIASFITDAGDPGLLEIPGGNWNFETYFQASSGGGTPSFYVELYKVDSGGTATLIASNSSNPELIAFGTTTTAYFSTLAVPTTTLAITDRLAIRYYVTNAGRTITLHTENSNLCQIITTFTTGLTALNGLTAQVQNFATGTSGTDFNISSTGSIHTFNLPDASASARGVVTTGSQVFGGVKTFSNGLSLSAVGGSNQVTRLVNIGTLHEGSATLNQIGFNSGNNIYFGKGLNNGGVISWNNAAVRYYTLQDADGTIAFTSDITSALTGYVTIGTAQTITGSKTFNSRIIGQDATLTGSGSPDTLEVFHTSGSGIAVDISKAGNGEGLRVAKTSGSGNAVTITGGLLSAEAGTFSGDLQSSTRLIAAAGGQQIILTPNLATTSNRIETTGSLPLEIVSGGNITFAAGGATPQITLASSGAATFSSSVTAVQGNFFQTSSSGLAIQIRNRNANQTWGLVVDTDAVDDKNLGIWTGSIYALKLNATSGAATFSSSVTAASGKFASANGTTYAATPQLRIDGNGVNNSYAQIVFTDSALSDGKISYFPAAAAENRFFSISARQVESDFVIRGSGSVGIGTASPVGKFEIASAANTYLGAPAITFTDTAGSGNSNRWIIGNIATNFGSFNIASAPTPSSTTFTPRLTITNSGNVGIGTASPNFSSYGAGITVLSLATSTADKFSVLELAGNRGIGENQNGNIDFVNNNGTATVTSRITALNGASSVLDGILTFHTRTSAGSLTERMRITSGGNVLINQTTELDASISLQINNKANGGILVKDGANSGWLQRFWDNSNNLVGSITRSGASTSFNTSSDYRLKENVKPVEGALLKLEKLKPCTFNFIADPEKEVIGFLAHEVQEVIPQAVHGEKDEVEIKQVEVSPAELDEEGNVITEAVIEEKEVPIYQGIDHSKLVPLLVASIQELKAEIEALKSQING